MSHLSFPKISGKLVNLRELSIDDTTAIVSLMSHEIAKYLYEVPYPYKIDDALYFIKSSYDDCRLRKAITFAIDYKNKCI
jgi:[ribosomal protein S5]-alanine N-acetyltransferase